MKKTLAIAIALIMTFSLAACSQSQPAASNPSPEAPAQTQEAEQPAPEPAQEPASGGSKVIAGLVFQEDQFFKLLASGYAAAAKDRGYEIQQTNTNNDQAKETEVLNTYASQKIAGVAISPLNTQVSPASVKAAFDAGLKVAICNSAIDAFPYAVASFSADNLAFCRQTGDAAAEFIKNTYPEDKVIKVGVVQFKTQVPEQSADRVNGFLSGLEAAGIKFEVIADQDAWLQDMAVAKVGDMISANPDLDIIFAANEGGTVGTTMAVENSGKANSIYVFGTDASEQIVGLLKDGNNVLQAVTGQDPFAIGYSTVDALINDIEGQPVDGAGKTNIIPGIPLNRGDVAGLDTFLEDLKSKM